MFPYYNTPFEIYQKKLRGTGTTFIRRFVLRCVPADYTVRGSIRFFRPLSRLELLGRVSVSIPLKRTARDRNPALSTFIYFRNSPFARPAKRSESYLKFNRSLESHAAQIFVLSIGAVAFRSGKITVERKRKRNLVGEAVLGFKAGKAVQIV